MSTTTKRRTAKPKPKPATFAAVSRAAADTDPAYLRCKTYGHSWQPKTVEETKEGFLIGLRCPRCTSTCTQEISRRGMLLTSRAYEYPEGYLFHEVGRIKGTARGAIRLACLEHDVIEARGKMKSAEAKGKVTAIESRRKAG